jgi:hypothetical protein
VVVDEYDIVVHEDAAPGVYVIEVGMYDPENLQRLAVLDASGETVGDHVLLGEVAVE